MKLRKIAITHASSLLAEPLLEMMAQSGIDPESIVLLDTEEQAGNRLPYGHTHITVLDQQAYDYEDLLAVFLLERDNALQDLLRHADCYVASHVDVDSKEVYFFAEARDLSGLPQAPASIQLASSELSTLVSILRPLRQHLDLDSVQVVNVLSASRWNKPGVDELASQTIELLNGREVASSVFPMQLAFNMIPQSGDSRETSRLAALMDVPGLNCSIQDILVPAFYGLCIAVVLESKQNIQLNVIQDKLASLPGLSLSDDLASPRTHCNEGNKSIIFGLNQPQNDAKRLQFWIMADSVRNGLINNYHNLMEFLINSHL